MSQTPASRELETYVLNQIGAMGYTFEKFQEYGINSNQVLTIAHQICWIARSQGSAAATIDNVSAHSIGLPMMGLIGYTLDGENCTVYEWLEVIAEILKRSFEAEYVRRENE